MSTASSQVVFPCASCARDGCAAEVMQTADGQWRCGKCGNRVATRMVGPDGPSGLPNHSVLWGTVNGIENCVVVKLDELTDPVLKDRLTLLAERGGVLPDKFAFVSYPLNSNKRVAVMMLMYPPEELRNQPLDIVRAVVERNATGMLTGIIHEIHRSYTTEPVSPTAARNIADELNRTADAQTQG